MPIREIYLDFIRGIAILLAMGWHFNNTLTGVWGIDLFLTPGREIGWAGVDLFFVLSGFLIGGLIFNEYQKTGNFRVARFLIRRAFKIWPILYLYLILLLVSGRYSWESFLIQNIFHVQNYFVTPVAHLWSLAVEEHFYLLFAFGLMILIRSKAKNLRVFAIILPVVLVVAAILRIVAYYYSVDPHQIQIQTQFRVDALAAGVLLAYVKTFHQEKFDYLSERKIFTGFLVLAGIYSLVHFKEIEYFKYTAGYTISYLTGVAFLLFCRKLHFIEARNFVVNSIAWIGIYSYAMYVYQFVMIRIVDALLKKFDIPPLSGAIDLFIKYAGAIILAVLLTKLVERPCLSLRDKMFPSYS
ncbi:hypothetical protein A1353_16515 [Methylomonas methanica]|uniref:Acyltransferase 3 domain-containing protein n=1 Tax=Methylomonas methanica TaxID=421 RepID=A0A177MAP5_METMH|nr:acyltransferase [Methylomonas methanica]OAI02393.1 hypothetical protein A1353_16515 [Methylomonas methanica]